jgi:putative endonuclease
MLGRVIWSVYLARCADGTLYCGIALDVAARLAQHDAGKGARYTRGRGPLALVLVRRCADKGRALRLEYAIKRLSREAKEALIAEPRRLAALARRARPQERGAAPPAWPSSRRSLASKTNGPKGTIEATSAQNARAPRQRPSLKAATTAKT